MSSAVFNAINRSGLSETEQNAVEYQIETASTEEINHRVSGFPVGGCRCYTDYPT